MSQDLAGGRGHSQGNSQFDIAKVCGTNAIGRVVLDSWRFRCYFLLPGDGKGSGCSVY